MSPKQAQVAHTFIMETVHDMEVDRGFDDESDELIEALEALATYLTRTTFAGK